MPSRKRVVTMDTESLSIFALFPVPITVRSGMNTGQTKVRKLIRQGTVLHDSQCLYKQGELDPVAF